jgi:hypothetical protein
MPHRSGPFPRITVYITNETATMYYKSSATQHWINKNPPYISPNNSLWYQTPQNFDIGKIIYLKHHKLLTTLTAQQWQLETALPLHKPAWL